MCTCRSLITVRCTSSVQWWTAPFTPACLWPTPNACDWPRRACRWTSIWTGSVEPRTWPWTRWCASWSRWSTRAAGRKRWSSCPRGNTPASRESRRVASFGTIHQRLASPLEFRASWGTEQTDRKNEQNEPNAGRIGINTLILTSPLLILTVILMTLINKNLDFWCLLQQSFLSYGHKIKIIYVHIIIKAIKQNQKEKKIIKKKIYLFKDLIFIFFFLLHF